MQREDSREEFQNKDLTKKRRFKLVDRCTTSETFHDMQIAIARAPQLCRPNVGTIG